MNSLTVGAATGRAPDSLSVNPHVADKLRQAADLLAQQGANPFRVSAYRRAADAITRESWDLRDILDRDGVAGLVALPFIGRGIAAAIVEMLRTGRWSQLERLRGTLDPVRVFQTVPGIGPALAARVHDTLGIDTLEALEIAAHDGRLEAVPGIGARRAAMVRGALQNLLGSTPASRHPPDGPGGGDAARRRSRVPGEGGGGGAADDRAPALQPRGNVLAPHAPYASRPVALHRALLEYRARP